MMNFLAEFRRSSLILVISTLSALACASAGAQPRTPKAHSRTTLRPAFLPLNVSTTILVSADEGSPIQHTAEDLANDFHSVTGQRAKIVHDRNDASGVTLWIASPSKLAESIQRPALTGPESFSISVTSLEGSGQRKAILLTGADVRGTIYAVYQFSQEFLGVDPLYYWTDHDPPHRTTIEIPAALSQSFPAPVFAYRGFFINDEDLLTGWAPGESKDKTGISLEVWDKIYETILRLKGNMVAPGTWIFPDDPQVKLAGKRGLIVTQHHALPLGLNVARWPKDVPYNYSEHPEILERAWKNAVSEYLPDQEVLWSVGLRGLSDVSYASMDPSVRDNNKALGALITKAIGDQIRIVRAVRPNAHFVTNLWQEGARLVEQGDLKIPAEVGTVWADDGYGYLQDHGEVTRGQGAYDHVAMMNGRANQLTEMVPVERSFSEIGRYMQAGATNYFLVNTSDIRPVPMSIRAVMDAVWGGLPKGADAENAFYRQWSEEEFGEKARPRLAKLYQQYFRAPARSGNPEHEYGDQLYHTEARLMMLSYMTDSPLYSLPSQSPKWEPPRLFGSGFGPRRAVGKEWLNEIVPREIEQCGDAEPRWDAIWKEALAIQSLIPAARQPFYREQVLAMIAIQRESNRTLFLIAQAIRDAENGNASQARNEATQALAALDAIAQAETGAEYGKWKKWYRGDWLTGVYRTRQMVEVFREFLDEPVTPLSPPVLWDGWEAYYHIMHYEGDRSADVK